MSNKVFAVIIAVLILGSGVFVGLKRHPPQPRLGVAQANEGRDHFQDNGYNPPYKAKIPTSGPHTSEGRWGVSPQQIPDRNVIHNMEHGGVVISYRPDLDSSTVTKLQSLLGPPYTESNFTPSKVILMPRREQQKLIVLASWDRVLGLDYFDKQKIIDYYHTNEGKSPEPAGG